MSATLPDPLKSGHEGRGTVTGYMTGSSRRPNTVRYKTKVVTTLHYH